LSAIFELGAFTYSFLLIFASKFGFKIAFVPILYLIFTASAFLFAVPFGKLTDKIGRKNTLALSFLMWGLTCLSFIFFQSYWAIMATFVIYGIHRGSIKPIQKTLVAEITPARFTASTLGAFQMVLGICAFPASFIAGILWDKIGVFAPFYFALGMTIVAIFLLFFVKETRSEQGQSITAI